MTVRPRWSVKSLLGPVLAIAAVSGGLLTPAVATASASTAASAKAPPAVRSCDILARYHTPCMAAYSTTRALYGKYKGPLYRIKRTSDNKARTIYPVKAGGTAYTKPQSTFCRRTTCHITVIFDQSGHRRNLTPAGASASAVAPNPDVPARAGAAPVKVNGRQVYGVYVTRGSGRNIPGVGYRDNVAHIATGNSPEGIYEVVAGNHTDNQCCFDFGNAETTSTDQGSGHMEALYYGSFPAGHGPGPWVKADTENGLPSSGPAAKSRFTIAMLTDDGKNFQVLHGNATAGGLTAERQFSSPQYKQGAIVLGTGGDNSDWGAGTFYEGAVTRGAPSKAALKALQANIVAARYRA